MSTAKQVGKLALYGVAAALTTAIPLVDDGVVASEALSIILAGLVGTGLTAVTSPMGKGK